jgi:hypothetical protein
MAVKQKTSTKRPAKHVARVAAKSARTPKTAGSPKAPKASAPAKAAATNGGGRVRRVRMGRLDVEVHEPAEKDLQKRLEAIDKATSMVKTTARLLPSDLRWER